MCGKWPRNTDGLRKHAAYRGFEAKRKTEEAIKRLLAAGAPISFNAVSREARVSKAYLYRHADIKERIINLRSRQPTLTDKPTRESTGASKDVIILAKDNRIRQLEKENKYLKQLLQKAYGEKWELL